MELDLRLRLMRSLITAVAYTAVEQDDNLLRALELCELLDDCESELQLLAQQCASRILQGDIEGTERAISRVKRAAKRVESPILRSHETIASGLCALMRGELGSAEAHFGAGSELLAGADLREPTRLFGHDPAVLTLGYSTISTWLLGRPEEARRRAQLALSRAEAIGIPQVRVNALDTALTLEHLRRDAEAARPLHFALDACMEKFCVEYPYARPLCARNWLLLESGDAAAARLGMLRDIKKAHDARSGLFLPLMYITLSEACLATGTAAEGLEAIETAFNIIHAGERLFEAEAWRLKGELLRLESDPGQAEQCFRTALKVASEQSALALELRAATSLGELHLDTRQAPDARERLQAIIDRFTEGFDTADFRQGSALAASLAATETA
jgi:tetratricopeptide (TPR) repeat protein